ncbi:hypothetical protein [Gordonia neofelifaecis]|uniref:Mce-associated membrane protein n=1 Tax=Gordonia neofelifaecis NRRL B-59395 TaxID=644548 RepID=F1YHA7_9ACTN|nr:hypothetical protein [Gordonia neofelifaecis]EGD55745.1 hypothetical protein SCNU_05875 [Gordonia neofelifaecis NRRL B-59395]
MSDGSDDPKTAAVRDGGISDRDELLAENRARRAELREDREAKAAGKAAGDGDAEAGVSAEVVTGASPSTPRKTVVVFGVTVAVLLAVIAVLAYLLLTDDSAEADREAAATASEYATTVLTYSAGKYSDLDKRIREISTPEFADEYIKSSQQARAGNDEAQASGTARVVEAGVISRSDDEAVVLVAMNQNVKSPLAPATAKDGVDYESRIRITLTRDGDSWKLSELTVV